MTDIADLVAKLDARLLYHVGHPEDECTETMKLADFKAVRAIVVAAQAYVEAYDLVYGPQLGGPTGMERTAVYNKAQADILAAVRGEA